MVDNYEKLQKSSLSLDSDGNYRRGVAHGNLGDWPCLLENNIAINSIANENTYNASR